MKRKTEKKAKSLQVTLDYPITRCLNLPTKVAFAALLAVGEQLNRARVHYSREGVGWSPLAERLEKPGKLRVPSARRELPGDFAGYVVAREPCREICGGIVSSLVVSVQKDLNARLPYDAPEKKHGLRYIWQAIHEKFRNSPSYRSIEIPVRNGDTKWSYGGDGDQRLSAECGDRCVIDIPIWSKEAGRKDTRLRFEIDPKRDPDLVRDIASSRQKMGDSSLAINKKGKWVLRLCVGLPAGEELDQSQTAVLQPAMPKDSRPFLVEMHDGRKWGLGNGRVWLMARTRLEGRRKGIRAKSRDHAYGHGRKYVLAKLQPYSHVGQAIQDRFVKDAVSMLIRSLVRAKCGRLIYREPSKPLRERCWLGEHGLPFNWTMWLGYLKHKCSEAGIVLVETKITLKEARGDEEAKGVRGVRPAGNGRAKKVSRPRERKVVSSVR